MSTSMSNRRSFLRRVGFGLAITAAGTARLLARPHRINRLGMQLYTVRDAMAKDFDGTLAKVASLGYKEVEFAGYFKKSPQEVKAALAKHGLTSPSTHIGYDQLGDTFPDVIEASRVIGHRFIVNPWIDESIRNQPGAWKRAAETFNRAGELAKKANIQFAYHNHHFEFVPVDGTMPYDLLLKECDPDLVKMELDLCWITVAGQDPLVYFQRYPGRFPLVHVKGLKQVPAGPAPAPFDKAIPNITDVGTSDIVDWKRIFAKSDQAGIRHYFVEHDQPASPLDSLAASARYLQALRF
jgi:sugar phosphate isomerase/epimerase